VRVDRIRAEGDRVGDARVPALLGGGRDPDRFVQHPGLLDGVGRPGAGVDIVGGAAVREKVQRDHAELQAGPALEENHVEAIVEAEQPAGAGDGVVEDGLELLGAVAHLQDRHAGALVVEQVLLDLFEHRQGQRRRAGVEVDDARGWHKSSS
jgi:hypothetical protein